MNILHQALETILMDRFGWPSAAANEIAECAHVVAYQREDTIFHAGESTDLCYVLLSGEVKLYFGTPEGERVLVTILGSGALLGFANLGDDDAPDRQAGQLFTARALSRCKVAILARARLLRALHHLSGQQLLEIAQRTNDNWVELCSRLLGFLTMNVRSRLAHAIVEITDAFGIGDARGKLLSLKLSHQDFAELVGASRPMISKHLKELAQAGIFVKANGRYILAQDDLLRGVTSACPIPITRGSMPERLAAKSRMAVRRAQPHRAEAERAGMVAMRRAAE